MGLTQGQGDSGPGTYSACGLGRPLNALSWQEDPALPTFTGLTLKFWKRGVRQQPFFCIHFLQDTLI